MTHTQVIVKIITFHIKNNTMGELMILNLFMIEEWSERKRKKRFVLDWFKNVVSSQNVQTTKLVPNPTPNDQKTIS